MRLTVRSKIVYISILWFFFLYVVGTLSRFHDTKTHLIAKIKYKASPSRNKLCMGWIRKISNKKRNILSPKRARDTIGCYFHQTSALDINYFSVCSFGAHSHTRTFVTTQVFYVPSHSVKHLITHLGTVLRNPTVRSETFRREHQLVATRNRLQLLQQMFAYLLMS